MQLSTGEYWCIPVLEKTSEEILQVLLGWSISLGIELHECCFLTDRGGEFEDISPYVKNHVKTAAYSPQSNGAVERIHRELGSMSRLYETTPDVIAEMWRSGSFVGNIKVLPEVGSLILRYVQRKKPKTENNWIGPYVVLKQIGSKMVEALNLETNRLSVIHLNDLKEYFRPNTSEWNINSRFLREYCDRLEIDISEFVRPDLNVNWKNKCIFVDINNCADLEDIILKSLKDLLSKLLLVVPEFKERNFWV